MTLILDEINLTYPFLPVTRSNLKLESNSRQLGLVLMSRKKRKRYNLSEHFFIKTNYDKFDRIEFINNI